MDEKKISSSSWKKHLSLEIQRLKQNVVDAKLRVVVLGIGNELRGDDAAGILIARKLEKKFNSLPNVLIIDGAETPENFTSVIRRFQPHLVILIDAGDLGLEPGEIQWLIHTEILGGMGTHGLSLADFGHYLQRESNCRIGCIIIQATSIEFGAPVNPSITRAVSQVSLFIAHILNAGIWEFNLIPK